MEGSMAPKHYAAGGYIAVSYPGTGGAVGTTRINTKTHGEGRLFVFYVDRRTNWRTAGNI
jgi:hypothetical protein